MDGFRKVIKGWLGKVLLILFLIPLALVGIEGFFGGQKSADVVQSVNGQDISKKELEDLVQSFKEQYLNYTQGDETLLNAQFIEKKALDTLVGRALLLQQSKALGIALSDAQIEQMIAQQPTFQQEGKFSQTLYENYLRSVGMTSQSLIAGLRQDHALKMLSSSLLDHVLVSSSDIQQLMQLQNEQRQLHLASIDLAEYKKQVKVSDAEIAAYYKAHTAQFKQAANLDVDYVVLKSSDFNTAPVQVTDAELQQAYQQFVQKQQATAPLRVKHILVTLDGRTDAQAQGRIAQAQAELAKGVSFADVAKKYSDDTDSKTQGGLIDGYAKGAFGESFDQTVASLTAGQVSKATKTQYGYHLIETEPSTVTVASFEQEKARLQAELSQSKASNVFIDAVNSLNDQVVGSDSLDVVAQTVKTAKVERFNNMTLATQNAVLSDVNVKPKLFNDDVKNGNYNVSTSIQLANGDVAWVKVHAYRAAGEQSLAQATPRVKAKLIQDKAVALATAKIQSQLDQFKTQPAQKVLENTDIRFEQAGTFSRSQGLLKRQVERAAFSLAAPKAGFWSVTTTSLPNELIVVAVSEVKTPAQSSLSEPQLKELKDLYAQSRGEQELNAYIAYLKADAKIK